MGTLRLTTKSIRQGKLFEMPLCKVGRAWETKRAWILSYSLENSPRHVVAWLKRNKLLWAMHHFRNAIGKYGAISCSGGEGAVLLKSFHLAPAGIWLSVIVATRNASMWLANGYSDEVRKIDAAMVVDWIMGDDPGRRKVGEELNRYLNEEQRAEYNRAVIRRALSSLQFTKPPTYNTAPSLKPQPGLPEFPAAWPIAC